MDQVTRALRRLGSQEVARGNAAHAAAELRKRRREQDDVDAYLLARRWRYTSAVHAARDINAPSAT